MSSLKAARGVPNGSVSVMARRVEPPNSLDYFPTPPWATRALCEDVLMRSDYGGRVWEPAAGMGHMSEVLGEYFATVFPSDVHDYGRGYTVGSFVGEGPDVVTAPFEPDWVITNPPFNLAQEFVERGLAVARRGVAVLVRVAWLEGGGRYRSLFGVNPPHTIAIFAERVPMVKGRWDPDASSATSYAWVIWRKMDGRTTGFRWIPPGCRTALTKSDDIQRFASRFWSPVE
jgi:hypothetical protein